MEAYEALLFLEGYTASNVSARAALATLRACVEACDSALEWAAGFPLGIASTQPDIDAAASVYARCEAALKGESK